jgi:hypothetical protein
LLAKLKRYILPWVAYGTLINALFFGAGTLLITALEIHLPISGTKAVTDPREILVALGAAFTGPIGGIIPGLIQPVPAFSSISMFCPAIGGFFVGICYRHVYSLTALPRLIGWWVFFIAIYYFAIKIPFAFVGVLFNRKPLSSEELLQKIGDTLEWPYGFQF